MSLKVYNSLSRTKEDFVPLKPGHVSIYVCGPTVYNLLHVGNFRGPVFFNLVRNWLEHSGFKVKYVLNFTDVDDKIIDKANTEKVDATVISERYILEYKKDFSSLGLRPHDKNPKVSEHMDDITKMIETLVQKEKAYAVDGDVNFSIQSFAEYGKLSHRKTDDLLVGVRIDKNEKKKSPLDFALWKKCKDGEPYWNSPWGKGRPGWHIECSAMAAAHFGETLDIHGGGLDLMFPHHENEIAQSEGAHGKTFAKVWMHWNLINFSGQKMSKSVGNIVTMREFLSEYPAEVYKWMMLSSHYRSVGEFSEASISQAISNLARVYSALALAQNALKDLPANENVSLPAADKNWTELMDKSWATIKDAFNDDFNTPEVFAVVFDLVRQLNTKLKRGAKYTPAQQAMANSFLIWMRELGHVCSLFEQNAGEFLSSLDDLLLTKMNLHRGSIDGIVQERQKAREEKNFPRSDELRKKLTDLGISVSDLPGGSHWEVTK